MIFRKARKRNKEADRSKLLGSFPPKSRYVESFRTLRTNLFFSSMENQIRSILVTSALENEGKTNTAVNLGYAIAQTDRRVLLMDCDLRWPYLSSLMVETGRPGVSELVIDVFGVHLTRGSLTDYTPGDLILLARLQKRSARLDLESETTRAAVFFENGEIKDLVWKNPPDDRKLGATLVQENLITEKQAGLALAHQKKTDHRLGHILKTMGLVSRKDLHQALSVQAVEAVQQVCAMRSGEFIFSPPGMEPSTPPSFQHLDLEKLFNEINVGKNPSKYCHTAIENAIVPTEADNLFVLPSGAVPPNPAETVGSTRMAFLIDHLKTRFDFIIIDTPPVIPATDALVMAPMVDGTLFVVRSGHTNREIIHSAVDQFKAARQPVIGFVLNRVDMKKERYYQNYYASYYGR